MNPKTELLQSNFDWLMVKNVSRNTVNKNHTTNSVVPKFKQDILISEHSPIRELTVRWAWNGIKSWISTHYSRHRFECYIGTQRSDRTGINRDNLPQGALVNMNNSANAQQLIDVARKRLCYQSNIETRKYMESLKRELYISGETELSDVLVPNCVYRCGCSEFSNCGYFDKLHAKDCNISSTDIKTRYKAYSNIFRRSNRKE